MASKPKATGADLRAFFSDPTNLGDLSPVGSRGRFSTAHVAAFEKATGKTYVVGSKTPVKIQVKKTDKNGRNITVNKTVESVSTLRAAAIAAGETVGARGRLTPAQVQAAASHLGL